MSVASAPYYWLVCDWPDCGDKSTEGSDFAAWGSVEQAEDDAVDAMWMIVEKDGVKKHYCVDHSQKFVCPECGEEKEAEQATCGHPECLAQPL